MGLGRGLGTLSLGHQEVGLESHSIHEEAGVADSLEFHRQYTGCVVDIRMLGSPHSDRPEQLVGRVGFVGCTAELRPPARCH